MIVSRPVRTALALAVLVPACVTPPAPEMAPATAPAPVSIAERVRHVMGVLAADSLEGRASGTAGGLKAAEFLARELKAAGVEPAGDSGYFQRFPIVFATRADGRARLMLADSPGADTLPVSWRGTDMNVIGRIRGSDPAVGEDVVLVTAHYDHLGIGAAVNGDSIYNGADDDASGATAVVEIARALAREARPRRTVIFGLMAAEEVGLLGTRWYIRHPVAPLARHVANLNIEMIGRPDSAVGGGGRSWLTGYERSTMGEQLAANGIDIVADARPSFRFFERSDNIAFARLGIPAHTLSTYNLHADYHQPSDEASRIDAEHMARVIESATRAVRVLANGEAPSWKPGGRPEPAPR